MVDVRGAQTVLLVGGCAVGVVLETGLERAECRREVVPRREIGHVAHTGVVVLALEAEVVAEGNEIAHQVSRVGIHVLAVVAVVGIHRAEPQAVRIGREAVGIAEALPRALGHVALVATGEHAGVVRRVVQRGGLLVQEGVGAAVHLHVDVAEILVVLSSVVAPHLLGIVALAAEVAHHDVVADHELVLI